MLKSENKQGLEISFSSGHFAPLFPSSLPENFFINVVTQIESIFPLSRLSLGSDTGKWFWMVAPLTGFTETYDQVDQGAEEWRIEIVRVVTFIHYKGGIRSTFMASSMSVSCSIDWQCGIVATLWMRYVFLNFLDYTGCQFFQKGYCHFKIRNYQRVPF